MYKLLATILDASVSELIDLREELPQPLHLYRQVLLSYFKSEFEQLESDVREIQNIIESAEKPSLDLEIVSLLSQLRLQILKKEGDLQVVDQLLLLADRSPEWSGEIFIICASFIDTKRDFKTAQIYYHRAINALETIGAKKKTVKALLGYVAAESRIYPEKKLIIDYHHICKKAAEVEEWEVVGVTLTNISREYQLIGALHSALKYINQALPYLQRQ